jgi:hypothetical protein
MSRHRVAQLLAVALIGFAASTAKAGEDGKVKTSPVPAPPALVLGLIGVAGLLGKRAWSARKRTLESA